ncbi:MAG: trp operon repressor [Legionellales bacterium]|jgi:TrpR family trp operon transcriptional repressor
MESYSEQTGWDGFLKLCLKAKSVTALDKLMRLQLTQEEQQAVAMRYLIIKELLKGEKTQREMARDLHVSIAKITRGSNSVKLIDEELKMLLLQGISDV